MGLSPEASYKSAWQRAGASEEAFSEQGLGAWLGELRAPVASSLLSTLSSQMKGSPVPSCGSTLPPQVPEASRPHSNTTAWTRGQRLLNQGWVGESKGAFPY